jgi:hypothetical protein
MTGRASVALPSILTFCSEKEKTTNQFFVSWVNKKLIDRPLTGKQSN